MNKVTCKHDYLNVAYAATKDHNAFRLFNCSDAPISTEPASTSVTANRI